MLEKLLEWGIKENGVRALILLGSRAGHQRVDSFSDYDLSVFCDNDETYTNSESWLSQFGNVWVCVKEKVYYKEMTFPSRLVIFEGGIKVDFSFFSNSVLNEIAQSDILPEEYNHGYKILLDKDNRAAKILPPQFKAKAVKPSELEFNETVNEFWFEAYHVGIYLKRKDLWSVKFRSWAAHSFLLRMIQWHSQSKTEWQDSPPPNGKQMSSWVDQDILHDLQGVFAHFNAEDSWKALFNTIALFKRLTVETAQALQVNNREDLSDNMMGFIIAFKDDLHKLEKKGM